MVAPRKRTATPSTVAVRHEACWAKTTPDGRPGISVRDHCLNVGCVAEALIAHLPAYLRQTLPRGMATFAALHDIGKVSPGFQSNCEEWLVRNGLRETAVREGWSTGFERDHAKISQWTVQQLLGTPQLSPWAAAPGAHHGQVKGNRIGPVSAPWEEERRRLADELMSRFGPLPETPPEDPLLWFTAGLITTADWIGSNEEYFPLDAHWSDAERQRRARQALAYVGWKQAALRSELSFESLFPPYAANDLQRTAVEFIREPGVYVLEGPMGCGKTEAALAAAYRLIASGRANGIYFALPTQVTSNRIFQRVHGFLERAAAEPAELRLAHSASWLLDPDPMPALRPTHGDDEAREHVRAGRSWFASAKRALLAPFGVGTVDQALLGVVAAKHFFIRQFGLAGKVVILDEIHSYDLYTGTLIDALVRRLRELRSTVIILSATLTWERRAQLIQARPMSDAYPLLSGSGGTPIEVPCAPPPPKTVAVRFLDPSCLIEKCLGRAESGDCVLWIRNTVDDAQETYRRLKAAAIEGGAPIALLHSRFPFFRREELETCWMDALGTDSTRRPRGCVLISTQVAEQSVDIDSDLLITDLAPTDMLLQRLGRLWRHERPARRGNPEVWVRDMTMDTAALRRATSRELREALGKSARVYAPYVLLRSLAQWRTRGIITLPADIRAILEATYSDPAPDEPESWRELRTEMEERKRKLEACALSATRVWAVPALNDDEGVQTRYGTYPTVRLLLAKEISSPDSHSARLCLQDDTEIVAHNRDWSFEAAKAIHRNLVPVPRWTVEAELKKAPEWLAHHVSQPAAAALVRPDGSIRWFGDDRETGLEYHADQGIIIRRGNLLKASERDFDESYD